MHTNLNRRAVLAAAALAPGVSWGADAASPIQPHTLDELLKDPAVSDAAISPDGRQLAVLHQLTKGDKTNSLVALNPIDQLDATPKTIAVGDFTVERVEWGKNDRLLIWIASWKDAEGRPFGFYFFGLLIPIPVRRVVSVGLDGTKVVLFADDKRIMQRSFNAANVVDMMPHDPRRVLMQTWDSKRDALCLYSVDVYTGHAEVVEQGKGATDFWMTQRGVPMLRVDSNSRGTTVWVYGRAPGETEWKLVRKSRRDEWKKLPDFDILGPSAEPGVFYVSVRSEGEDTKAVRRFDLRTMQFGEVVGERPPRDVDGIVVDDAQQLLATASRADRLEYHCADKSLAGHIGAVNRALKGACNVALYDISADHSRVLLKATGPQEPGAFYLFDRDAKRLHMVATTKPWLDPARLARMESLKVKTRDGAEIAAYLSLPAGDGSKPRPMIVMPHGGPELRDAYDYDIFAQAFAARGWLVLQPNFRGSGGYGQAFADAGRRRWGDLMQQDVEDAVAHVVAAGHADPRRIAICGASYGGYAALMGPILRPDLYRCSVAIAAPSNLLEMLKFEREDGADSPSYKYWVKVIGDPKADAARLRAASPALRAPEFRIPLLMLHGGMDGVVPATQSELMEKALKAAGRPVERVVLPDVAHSDWERPTMKTILDKAADFIAKHI